MEFYTCILLSNLPHRSLEGGSISCVWHRGECLSKRKDTLPSDNFEDWNVWTLEWFNMVEDFVSFLIIPTEESFVISLPLGFWIWYNILLLLSLTHFLHPISTLFLSFWWKSVHCFLTTTSTPLQPTPYSLLPTPYNPTLPLPKLCIYSRKMRGKISKQLHGDKEKLYYTSISITYHR